MRIHANGRCHCVAARGEAKVLSASALVQNGPEQSVVAKSLINEGFWEWMGL